MQSSLANDIHPKLLLLQHHLHSAFRLVLLSCRWDFREHIGGEEMRSCCVPGAGKAGGVAAGCRPAERLFSLTALRGWHAQQDPKVSVSSGEYAVLSQALVCKHFSRYSGGVYEMETFITD